MCGNQLGHSLDCFRHGLTLVVIAVTIIIVGILVVDKIAIIIVEVCNSIDERKKNTLKLFSLTSFLY